MRETGESGLPATAFWRSSSIAALVEAGQAAVLWSLDGERGLSTAPGYSGIARALLAAGGSALRARLRRIAADLAAGSGIRLERIPLPQGYGVASVLFECHRVSTDEGDALLTVLRGRLPSFVRADIDYGEEVADRAGSISREFKSNTVESNHRHTNHRSERAPVDSARVAQLRRLAARRPTMRFVWTMDREDRFTEVSPELAAIIGTDAAAVIGMTWGEVLAAGIVTDGDDAVAGALGRRVTWSGRAVRWRIDGLDTPLEVELSAIPSHDSERQFQGYRGFGLCRLRKLFEDELAFPVDEGGADADGDDSSFALPSWITSAAERQLERPELGDTLLDIPAAANDTAGVATEHSPAMPSVNVVSLQAMRKEKLRQQLGAIPHEKPLKLDELRATLDKIEPPQPSVEGDAGSEEGPVPQAKQPKAKSSQGEPSQVGPSQGEPAQGEPAFLQLASYRELAEGDDSVSRAPLSDSAKADEPVTAKSVPVPETHGEPVRPHVTFRNFTHELTDSEKNAFREIARTLSAFRPHEHEDVPQDVTRQAPQPISEPEAGISAATENATEAVESSPAPDVQEPVVAVAEPVAIPLEPQPAPEPQPVHVSAVPVIRTPASVHGAEQADPRKFVPFELLADRLPLGIVVSRGETVLYINSTLLDLLGYASRDAFVEAGGMKTMFMSVLAGGDTPLALRTANNSPLSADARLTTVHWNGEPATLMSFRRAMEPRMEARLRGLELELRGQEIRLRELNAILDTAIDGVVVMDGKGRILSLNRSAEALFGYEEHDLFGKSFTDLLAPESHSAALEYFEGLRAGGIASVMNDGREIVGRMRQGGSSPLLMVMGRLDEQGDSATHYELASLTEETSAPVMARLVPEERYCMILRDLTEARRIEQELAAARRAAGRASAGKAGFLARVSHEIRSPLNAIIGFAEVMLEERFGPVGPDRYREYLRDIHVSGGQVIRLVNDLLDLAKIEEGQLELSPHAVAVNDVVSRCMALMLPQAGRARVVLRSSLVEGLPEIHADERALSQIVLNVLSNAVKFTNAGGQVIISTARGDNGDIMLRIRDTGIGMSRSDIDAVLEPFSTATTARAAADGAARSGPGLGLPLTQALVEASGGRLVMSSTRGEGTLVEIALPSARSDLALPQGSL